jgi:bacteriocin-like protein
MSKSETRTTDSGTANEPSALTDKELDAVTGGVPQAVPGLRRWSPSADRAQGRG